MRIRSKGRVVFGVGVGIRGDEVSVEGIWTLVKLKLGFRLGLGLGIVAGDGVGEYLEL